MPEKLPTWKEECAIAVFDNIQQVEFAVHILKRGGFPLAQISVISKSGVSAEAIQELKMQGDDSVHDAAVGAGFGGLAGALIGLEMSAVFGLGAVFFFGPIGLAMMGVVVGGLVGAMGGWGLHADRVQHYEDLMKAGKILLIAQGSPLEVLKAGRILKESGPLEVHLCAKSSSESAEIVDEEGELQRVSSARLAAPASDVNNIVEVSNPEGVEMFSENARERFQEAVGILADEKGGIKERLLIAYASQLSDFDGSTDLPPSLANQFAGIRYALSDVKMPYGYSERAPMKLQEMSDDEASDLARTIYSMFLSLHDMEAATMAHHAQA